jgi:hypothetical protein
MALVEGRALQRLHAADSNGASRRGASVDHRLQTGAGRTTPRQ